MKRLTALVIACCAGSCIAADAATRVQAVASSKSYAAELERVKYLAPADEYFGPLKMSIVGIRNTIRDTGLRYKYNHDIPDQTYNTAMNTELSIRDWEHKYPRDGQIPGLVFRLQRLYDQILTQRARDHAKAVANWLYHDFPKSPQAKQLRKTIAVERVTPLPFRPSPSPGLESAAPTGIPTPIASATGSPYASPSANVNPSASPGGTSSPSATPSATTTPTPNVTAAPSPASSPSAGASPSPGATASPHAHAKAP